MKVQISNDTWKMIILETEEFEKRIGQDIAGLTDTQRKQIFFSEEDFNKELVVHELCHAYYSGLCLEATTLSNEQIEEVFCEMFAKHGSKILKQASQIYKKLKDEA